MAWRPVGQCWNIVSLTLGNKLQWNLNRNEYIFIQENAFENVVWKMAAICLGLNVLKLYALPIKTSKTQPSFHFSRNKTMKISYSKSDCSILFNSLWPSDNIWQHRSGSTLADVKACCLSTQNHYLNQYRLIIHQWGLVVFNLGQFHRKYSNYLSLIWVWKSLIWYYRHIFQEPMS